MKAKELAELLLENPDFEAKCIYEDTSHTSSLHVLPFYTTLKINGIADIGYSDKVILLDCDEEDC